MKPATTLPRLLQRNAASFGTRPALREKRGGIWQVLSWSDYAAMVSRFAAGLAAQGFCRGDRLAVIGDNRPHLYGAMLAAQSLGGVGVPLWPDAEPDAIAQVLQHAGVSIVVAEDDEQAGKIVAIKDRLSKLRLVVQTASHGMRQIEHDWLKSFKSIAGAGTGAADQSEPGDLALLLYGNPPDAEGVKLSHANLLTAAETLMATEDIRQTDETLAWLPMGWLGDVLSSLALSLSVGFTCNCPERPETARRDLREIGPTILIAPPRIWEDTLADIETRAMQATPMKRALFACFRAIAERAEGHRAAGDGVPVLLRLQLVLGEGLVYAPMRDQIGLRRLRWANTGGEPLAPRVLHGFRAFGINLKESYGMQELAAAAWEPAHA
jgi:long-chain acyl-CoA synthetase